MGVFTVTVEAVAALRGFSAQLKQEAESIVQESAKVEAAHEENADGLGHHSDAVKALLDDVNSSAKEAKKAVNMFCVRLESAANTRKKHINSSLYGAGSSKDGSVVSSITGKVYSEKEITSQREAAVRKAWAREKELVRQGKGTRDWTVAQQAEILGSHGRVSGYEGQHMKDVEHYPDFAGDPNNIQFLPEGSVHLAGAHGGKYANGSNGRYDEKTGKIIPFKEDEVVPAPAIDLTSPFDPISIPFTRDLPPDFGYGGSRQQDYKDSKSRHGDDKSIKTK